MEKCNCKKIRQLLDTKRAKFIMSEKFIEWCEKKKTLLKTLDEKGLVLQAERINDEIQSKYLDAKMVKAALDLVNNCKQNHEDKD